MSRSQTNDRWLVVGGGILGMTLALRLAQQGRRVTLLESAPQLGGLADAWKLGDVTWDRHYHVILPSDSLTRGLLAEVGLDDQLKWVQTKTGFLVDGKFHSMSSSWEFLRFPPLSLWQKFRLATTIIGASRINDGKPLESILVEDWLRKWSGNAVVDRIWLPLLRAKMGENYRRTSAMFIWATIKRMYAARKSGAKKEVFGYVPGGYAVILERLQRLLEKHGVEVVCGAKVQSLTRSLADSTWRAELADGTVYSGSNAVVTAPATVAAAMCPELSVEERARLEGVEYQGIVCASLLLKKPLGPYYVTNITDPAPFTAVIEMSALVDRSEFGGKSLVYLPWYLPSNDKGFEDSDEILRSRYVAALSKFYPGFSDEQIEAFQVSRVRRVMAVPTLDYSQRAPQTVTSLPGLFIVNSSQITDGTLNVNETVRLATDAMPIILKQEHWSTTIASRQEAST
jgi:protoporphyrinogen oxidase